LKPATPLTLEPPPLRRPAPKRLTFRLSLKRLANFSRRLATSLEAGIPLLRALQVMSRNSRGADRRMYDRLIADLEGGSTFGEALELQGRAFPVMFKRLVTVGESSGGLDIVLKQLADYYDFVRSIWRKMIGQLMYPIFEYLAMAAVLAILAYVFTMIGNNGSAEMAALKVFGFWVGVGCLPIAAYFLITRALGGARPVHEVLIRIPGIGGIFRTLALSRFCWSMDLMLNAGVPIFNAVTWSLESTANGAYAALAPRVVGDLKEGIPLAETLRGTGLFPDDLIEMVHVGTESGSMPDLFRRMSRLYQEKFDLAMKAVTIMLGWLVWFIVAGVIIYHIFTLYGATITATSDLLKE